MKLTELSLCMLLYLITGNLCSCAIGKTFALRNKKIVGYTLLH